MLTIIKTSTPLIILSFLLTTLLQAKEVTAQNWLNHPEIKQIRDIYKAIEQQVANKTLHKIIKHTDCELQATGFDTTLYNDHKNTRKYSIIVQSEDSKESSSYYYDQQKMLRFIFSVYNEVGSNRQETRRYYNASGQHLYTNYSKGSGFTPQAIKRPRNNMNHLCH
ncbi:MAG: hypothetical protein KAG10_08780 [Methylococcales bacterium]|nr:hypothetical protein [Methylococcales bacterium]MCK5925973.1 hypothetical protein [Methylococcales bacterium]